MGKELVQTTLGQGWREAKDMDTIGTDGEPKARRHHEVQVKKKNNDALKTPMVSNTGLESLPVYLRKYAEITTKRAIVMMSDIPTAGEDSELIKIELPPNNDKSSREARNWLKENGYGFDYFGFWWKELHSIITPPEYNIKTETAGDIIKISFKYDVELVNEVRKIDGRVWNQTEKVWEIPSSQQKEVDEFIAKYKKPIPAVKQKKRKDPHDVKDVTVTSKSGMVFSLKYSDHKNEIYTSEIGEGVVAQVSLRYHTIRKFWSVVYEICFGWAVPPIEEKGGIQSRMEAREIALGFMENAGPKDYLKFDEKSMVEKIEAILRGELRGVYETPIKPEPDMGKVKFVGDSREYQLNDGVHTYLKIVKVRKPQECILCRREIQKGEEAVVSQSQVGVYRNYVREYTCNKCFKKME